jgi:hypothetical protein
LPDEFFSGRNFQKVNFTQKNGHSFERGLSGRYFKKMNFAQK